jgi:predicted dehydrogenase
MLMLKVAIVGCGKIADEHARQIRRIRDSELVGLHDAEPLMAKQMHDRFDGVRYFDDMDRMLLYARPDVVHITTPPQSHYSVAVRCLEAGCHVFVEKPFTMDESEAGRLIRTATNRGLKVGVDHNLQFTGPAVRMQALVESGFLGGSAVHVESHYSYNLGDPSYARAFLSDSGHWLRALPGGLLQNVISHGIGRIAQYLTSDHPTVIVQGFTSTFLKSVGETTLLDELRVLIKGDSTTAYFTFSSQIRPQISQLRVFGPKNGLFIDDEHHVLIRLKGTKYKSWKTCCRSSISRLNSWRMRPPTSGAW